MGFVDRCPGSRKDQNHYITYKMIDKNWILFNDMLVQRQPSIGVVHQLNLVMYRQSSSTGPYSVRLLDLSQRQTKRSAASSSDGMRNQDNHKIVYKTKFTTHTEDMRGILMFDIKFMNYILHGYSNCSNYCFL